MNGKTPRTAVALIAGTLWASLSFAATAPQMDGSIVGFVTDSAGVPQMGASVLLYSRNDRLLGKTYTTAKGTFGFIALSPDVYSVKVDLTSFLPALKKNILVQPGMQSLLNVNLASVLSSIELIYTGPGQIMSDDWKWVLRSSTATRPVLRFGGDIDFSDPVRRRFEVSSVFSGTRGLLKVSGGDQVASMYGNEPDLGTTFALATSVFGNNQFEVLGNFGYSASSGIPTTAFRTSYRREAEGGMTPEVKLTLRQLNLPGRVGAAVLAGQQDGAPALRTMSVTMLDETQLLDDLRLEYGFALDTVTFLDRLNYFSPFARMTYDAGDNGVVQFSYSSGMPPAELLSQPGEIDMELQQDITALSLFPRVSLRSGAAHVQRSVSYEIGYSKDFGSRTFSIGVYREEVQNSALTLASPDGLQTTADFLPDLFSNSWVFNAGGYRTSGMVTSLTQNLGDKLDVSAAYGTGGALSADRELIAHGDPDSLRELVRVSRRHSLTGRVSGRLPATGTRFSSSYQWTNVRSLTPAHVYLTQRIREGLGWNVYVRQPLPYFSSLHGRIEANAELRNLLAQGYVPIMAGGRRLVLMHTPRSFRGGLSFIF